MFKLLSPLLLIISKERMREQSKNTYNIYDNKKIRINVSLYANMIAQYYKRIIIVSLIRSVCDCPI